MWVRGLYIAEYSLGTTNNHIAVHDRKLLLNKRELKKLESKMKEQGYTIVPLKVFFNEKNIGKLEIGIGRGKKLHDKRDSIKKRETDREIKRFLK
jgi:SsrA-binding protein